MSSVLLDIQGLRCLAVTFVLLFHLWPTVFTNGFLGVDIFFVISGYLMCKILHGKEMTISTTKDFYFRRIKRIVPLYLTTILFTLTAAFILMPSFEYPQVSTEAKSAMFFVSNFFNLPKTGYFDLNNQYPLFLHTWSLSVEIQFYTAVPFIFFAYNKLGGERKGGLLLLVIAMGSLAMQFAFLNDANISHMAFYCRIWQFLCGFSAYLFHSIKNNYLSTSYSSLPSNDDKLPLIKTDKPNKTTKNCSSINVLISNVFVVLLFLQLSYSFIDSRQLERLTVTLTATLLLCCQGPSVLSTSSIVWIGDISYAIYLVHWPLFTLFKYSGYNGSGYGIRIPDGVFLLLLTIITSHLLENVFKYISTNLLQTWKALLTLIGILYCASFLMIHTMEQQSKLSVGSNLTDGSNLEKVVIDLFEKRGENRKLTVEEVLDLNVKMKEYQPVNFRVCHEKPTRLDTNYNVNISIYEYMCYDKGTGTKEMIVIGNSLSRDILFGIQTYMKDVYSHLTMLSMGGCIPFLPEMYDKEKCQEFVESLLPMIENWMRPVDIVVTQYSWLHLRPFKHSPTDEFQQAFQSFYSKLGSLVKDTIIMNRGDIIAEKKFQEMQNSIQKGAMKGPGDYPLETHRRDNIEIYPRIDALDCPKCLKLSIYEESFCSDLTNKCNILNENGVMNSHDGRHLSMYGSLVMGHVLRMEYDKWTAQRTGLTSLGMIRKDE